MAEIRDVKYGTYEGRPTISIPVGREGWFTFGIQKAKAILEYVDDIEKFVILKEKQPHK